MTDSTSRYFTPDHRRCDETWARFEAAVTRKDLEAARKDFELFARQVERHFKMEEEVLFPAFEEATGMHDGGPTHVMRHEHAQMRALLQAMAEEAAAGNVERVLDQGDTLLMLVGQHNAKEEGMLYRMADNVLAGEWEALEARLREYQD